MEKKKKKKYSRTDKVILGIGFTILGLFVLSIAIPIIYVVLASFMDPTVLNNQGLSFNIKDWTLDAYRRVLENEMIWLRPPTPSLKILTLPFNKHIMSLGSSPSQYINSLRLKCWIVELLRRTSRSFSVRTLHTSAKLADRSTSSFCCLTTTAI